MIVDASALVAVLRDEVEAASIVRALLAADACRVSAATYLEAAIVVDGSRDPVLSRRFDDLLAAIPIAIDPVTEAQARIARHAYRDFGRGAGHPARLNYGDCFSYALAKDRDEPLLFTGRDFRETDVRAALS